MPALRSPSAAPFWMKPVAAAVLALAADQLLYRQAAGANLGLVFLLATLAVALAAPTSRKAWPALLLAAAFAALMIEAPGRLALVFCVLSLGVAALSARAGARDDAWRWAQRLGFWLAMALVAPILDFLALRKHRTASGDLVLRRLPVLVLPVVGGMVFVALFTAANPVIAQALGQMRLPLFDPARLVFAGLVGVCAWALLRPRFLRTTQGLPAGSGAPLPGVSVASVGLSLVVFNALFALQNGLDVAFLWSRAPLPEGVTLAEYAHRGAYPLIATALLAGLFVLVALAPGSATARSTWLRRLVVLWVAQNLFLVASSILRTADYIDAYGLTRLRIAALIWMALVGVGLALICWRMLRGKSGAWLVNANVLAAGVVLAACAVIDLGAVAADWNSRHARDVGGRASELDVCYLERLGDSSVVALSRLRARPLPQPLAARAAWSRTLLLEDLSRRQADWRSWTWRGERRLRAALALGPSDLVVRVPAGLEDCDGYPMTNPGRVDPSTPPRAVPLVPIAPLTSDVASGTSAP
ncbi:DUF4173 domain-containing protein [Caulobacter flavus]|uniref:DUF4173 domain-containing protein n=1 Tax=Caulobacter flavus TaxID=1679497 RepID=A0A2N5CLN2_9CAUL|nr:DUF4173 domain-containing protein [Caulobacter flavus]AYV48851.1 DUF4173 domain-containing protein [Caulobacter flavus]PLR06691.1 DUF4173 domain-containing protein [Caulobacter flavus]